MGQSRQSQYFRCAFPRWYCGGKTTFYHSSTGSAIFGWGPRMDGIYLANPNDPAPTPASMRTPLKVRLLQIDLAVRDTRVNSTTGWVFGTFVYGGGPGGRPGRGWTNVSPVGLMWGNDPGYSGVGQLKETILNQSVRMPHVGFQGRLNGPVDNPISSCTSCHSTAESPIGTMIAPPGVNPALWFRNIPSGTPFNKGAQSLDYSLQLAVGLANFYAAHKVAQAATPGTKALVKRTLFRALRPPRDGGLHRRSSQVFSLGTGVDRI